MKTELEQLRKRVASLEAEQGRLEGLIIRLVNEMSSARLGKHHRTLLAEMRLRLYQRSFKKPTRMTIEEQMSKLVEQKEKPSRLRRSRLFDW